MKENKSFFFWTQKRTKKWSKYVLICSKSVLIANKYTEYWKYGTYFVFKPVNPENTGKHFPKWAFFEYFKTVNFLWEVSGWIMRTKVNTKNHQSWDNFLWEMNWKVPIVLALSAAAVNVRQRRHLQHTLWYLVAHPQNPIYLN